MRLSLRTLLLTVSAFCVLIAWANLPSAEALVDRTESTAATGCTFTQIHLRPLLWPSGIAIHATMYDDGSWGFDFQFGGFEYH